MDKSNVARFFLVHGVCILYGIGYRTMPRPAGGSAQYGVLQIGDEVDQRRQMNDPPPQQQLRRQSQPVTTNNIMHVRQYANILDSRSVQV